MVTALEIRRAHKALGTFKINDKLAGTAPKPHESGAFRNIEKAKEQ